MNGSMFFKGLVMIGLAIISLFLGMAINYLENQTEKIPIEENKSHTSQTHAMNSMINVSNNFYIVYFIFSLFLIIGSIPLFILSFKGVKE